MLNNLEGLSYIFTIVTGLSIFLILIQIIIAILDSKTRSRREAATTALYQAEKFAKEILPKISSIEDEIGDLVGWEPQEMKQFSYDEMDTLFSNTSIYRKQIKPVLDLLMERKKLDPLQDVINQLDALALCFTKRVGDHNVVYSSLGGSFCKLVEKYYFIYCLSRKDISSSSSYENTIQLYHIWKEKDTKSKLTRQIDSLRKEYADVSKTKEVKAIGT